MKPGITVILNLYKRPDYLMEQLDSILEQSVKPTEVWLWINPSAENKKFNNFSKFDRVVKSFYNFKYHGRFALGLLADTEYVAVFDDDTIPGKDWFSNCLEVMEKTPGILGGAGCILQSPYYVHHTRVGWPSQNKEVIEVDLVGHAWFFKREHLNYMWYEVPYSFENCEDMHFSFMAKKHGGVKTLVPPHPPGEFSKWSSVKALEYGNDNKASSNGSLKPIKDFYKERDDYIQYSLNNGSNFINL